MNKRILSIVLFLCFMLAIMPSAAALDLSQPEYPEMRVGAPTVLYAGPDSSHEVVEELNTGDTVFFAAKATSTKQFVAVQSAKTGNSGYIARNYLQTDYAVVTSSAKLYSAPDSKTKSIGSLKKGSVVTAFLQAATGNGNWLYVVQGDKVGYVLEKYVTHLGMQQAYTLGAVTMTEAPGKSKSIMKLFPGQGVGVISEADGYAYITVLNKTGYVPAQYLTTHGINAAYPLLGITDTSAIDATVSFYMHHDETQTAAYEAIVTLKEEYQGTYLVVVYPDQATAKQTAKLFQKIYPSFDGGIRIYHKGNTIVLFVAFPETDTAIAYCNAQAASLQKKYGQPLKLKTSGYALGDLEQLLDSLLNMLEDPT